MVMSNRAQENYKQTKLKLFFIRSVLTGALWFLGSSAALPNALSGVRQLEIPAHTELQTERDLRRSVTAADLFFLRDIGGMTGTGLSVSPDGKHVAFEVHRADLAENTYRVAWFTVGTTGTAQAINVGDGGDPVLFRPTDDDGTTNGAWISERPVWTPDSQWILYRRRIDGKTQIWRSKFDGSRQEQVTDNPSDVQNFKLIDGEMKIAYAVSGDRASRERHRRLADQNGYLVDLDKPWSMLQGRPYAKGYVSRSNDEQPEVWILDLSTGSERLATSEERAEYTRKLKGIESHTSWLPSDARSITYASPAGRAAAWFAPAEESRRGLDPPLTLYWNPALETANATRCSASECTGMMDYSSMLQGGLWWSEDNRYVYFVRRDGPNYGRRTLYRWKPDENHVKAVLTTYDWISDCVRSGWRAICFQESATSPRRLISIDLHNGSISTLFDPNPEFQAIALSEVRRLEWKDPNGNSTFGYLVLPRDYRKGTRYPLIIVGYRAKRTMRGGTGDEYPVHLYAANGFAVLTYDFPDAFNVFAIEPDGRKAWIRTWENGVPSELKVGASLIEAAIDVLVKQGIVDAERVGITGFSEGASLASYMLVHSSRFKAAALSSIPWNPIGYYLSEGGAAHREMLRAVGLGGISTPYGVNWRNLSLALNAGRVSTPILLNASDGEYLPALETAVAFAEAEKPFEMYVYPDEHHVKWQPAHRWRIWQRNLDWFKFWLLGEAESTPLKREQFQRWEKLRSGSEESESSQY